VQNILLPPLRQHAGVSSIEAPLLPALYKFYHISHCFSRHELYIFVDFSVNLSKKFGNAPENIAEFTKFLFPTEASAA